MAANKLNVFHWHITDSQSFPIVLPSVPNLANFGSYSPAMRYTDQDVRRIVRFAEAFGIRVIPEIDMPGKYCTGSCNCSFLWLQSSMQRLQGTRGRGRVHTRRS
jgi:hypothetical protein